MLNAKSNEEITPIEHILIKEIQKHGHIDLASFMNIALYNENHGYYRQKDPLGQKGDFITSPEISQIFGELIGLWVADVWMQMQKPSHIHIIELGPGRGTLMADALRAMQSVSGLYEACEIHLIETSPILTKIQQKHLSAHDVNWSLELPGSLDGPVIILANEFLDAFPIRQIKKTEKGWKEKVLGYKESQGFIFKDIELQDTNVVPNTSSIQFNCYYEISPDQDKYLRDICNLISDKGAALLIDYGHAKTSPGETLQAIKNHEFTPIIENIGTADITAHVNFERLLQVASDENIRCHGPITQAEFLYALGIEQRAEQLARAALKREVDQEKRRKLIEEIKTAQMRLTDISSKTGMGQLFKVICLSHGISFKPAGF